MKQCAYCDAVGNLTNEHVFPKFIYKAQSEMKNHYLLRKDAFINTELTVKDVCRNCNNDELSQLDGYAAQLYREYFEHIVRKKEQIKFTYDFDLLGRWLLKLAYNSARANAQDCSGINQNIKDYILTGLSRPKNLTVMLQLVIPHKLTEEELQKVEDEETRETGEIAPLYTRIMYTSALLPGVTFIKGIALYSYYFYIVLGDDNISPYLWQKKISNVRQALKYPYILQAHKNEEEIKASKVTILQALEANIYKTQTAYENKMAKEISPQNQK